MFGWLAKKGENARVFMCIKEVKWELEMADATKRAAILVMAQNIRRDLESELPPLILDRPLDMSRNDLMHIYGMIENVRNQGTMQLEQTKKGLQRLGVTMPQFAVDHAKLAAKALEVWMCTLGAGICPDKRDDVREIWRLLMGALPNVNDGVAYLKKVEQMTGEMTGHSGSMFEGLNEGDLAENCAFVPSAFHH